MLKGAKIILVGIVLFLTTGCQQGEDAPSHDANDKPLMGAIVPWPPKVFGGGDCPPISAGTKPLCKDFAALKQCLREACEAECDNGKCEPVFYKNGCPTQDRSDREFCWDTGCAGEARHGSFPIGQYFCTASDPETGESPSETEKKRCKKELGKKSASGFLGASRSTSLDSENNPSCVLTAE